MVKIMNLNEIIVIINGTLCTENQTTDIEIRGGCGADLMSDVLTSIQPQAVLLTGLCNPQVVRTADMADVSAIVFVRGKCPHPETIELANQENIPIISTPLGMFEVCGRLYSAGLPSLENELYD
jgi:predicted transcriptional regulator